MRTGNPEIKKYINKKKRTEISWLVGEIELIFLIRTAELKSYKLKY